MVKKTISFKRVGIRHLKDEYLMPIAECYIRHGKDKVFEKYKEQYNYDTLLRYIGEAKRRGLIDVSKNKVLEKIASQYTNKELIAISQGGNLVSPGTRATKVDFDGEHIKIGAITDTHIGHVNFHNNMLMQAFEEFKKEKVDIITHSGDVTEGMSVRQGQIYELSEIGYDKQKQKAIELFSQWRDSPVYMIDGNHDRWYYKGGGALMVKDICKDLKGYEFIGSDEGDIKIKSATVKLFHGEDSSSSYALSYRVQKFIEMFPGGAKPNVILFGHVHKYVKVFERNIYAISVGCLQEQTKFFRSKRIAAHVGFCVVDLWIGKKGVTKMSDTWYPFYV